MTFQTAMRFLNKKSVYALSALSVLVGLGVGHAYPHNHTLCEGFVPENNVKIPVGAKYKWTLSNEAAGITEVQFNEVIDRAERIFASKITEAGGTLQVNRKWTDPTVNASAQQFGTTWVVNMYGGLARHPAINVEGFALVVCHELGHHIGGAPKIAGWYGSEWATNEGGADYYATMKCLREYFAEDDNAAIVAEKTIDAFAKTRCEEQFPNSEADKNVCLRMTLAGSSVALLFQDLRDETTAPAFNTPDPRQVNRMQDTHPATQFRLDTYFNGATCTVSHTVPNSTTDWRAGSCIQGTDTYGWRPRCWFKGE